MTATRFTMTPEHPNYPKFAGRKQGLPQCRRNGKTKTWKRQPERWEVPVKYGLWECFRITNEDAAKYEVLW